MQGRRGVRGGLGGVVLVGTLILLGSGCSAEPWGPAEQEAQLRAQFPEQAGAVLRGAWGFEAGEEGWTVADLDAPAEADVYAASRDVELVLPRYGEDAVHLRLADGLTVRVRELGLGGRAEAAGAAVVYERAGGASFWTVTEAGYDEWLLLPKGRPREGIAWEVEGVEIRQHGRAVDLYDATGRARLTVAAPAAYRRDGSAAPVRLWARGRRVELEVEAEEGEALLVDPAWVEAGSMTWPRVWHTATLLEDGRVLVAGGQTSVDDRTDKAELFDPVTDTWSPAALMSTPRANHTATRLLDGRVLVAGGDGVAPGGTAELYDAATDSWSSAGTMNIYRSQNTATLLPKSGKVLLAGGGNWTSELYEPTTNSWGGFTSMSVNRSNFAALVLPDEDVLVIGGDINETVMRYHPSDNTWGFVSSMKVMRALPTATLLSTGQVLVAGGFNGGYLHSAELYDPAKDVWTPAASMNSERDAHTATLLPDGRVLAVGGSSSAGVFLNTTEIYDVATSMWFNGPPMKYEHSGHGATMLLDGRILVTGGWGYGIEKTAELYRPDLGTPCSTNAMCESGFCVQGVCCNSACDSGACFGCRAAVGALSDGVCTGLSDIFCDDGNACTKGDRCYSGLCLGNPLTCPVPKSCHLPGTCDTVTGICSEPVEPDRTPCGADGKLSCEAGECLPPRVGEGGGGAGGQGGRDWGTGGEGGLEATGGCGCRWHEQPRGTKEHLIWMGVLVVFLASRLRPMRRCAAYANSRARICWRSLLGLARPEKRRRR